MASNKWLNGNPHWSKSTREINTIKLGHLLPSFGRLLLTEVTPERISQFQSKRQRNRASNREINMEIGVLRMILRKHRLWHLVAPDYHPPPEYQQIGLTLS